MVSERRRNRTIKKIIFSLCEFSPQTASQLSKSLISFKEDFTPGSIANIIRLYGKPMIKKHTWGNHKYSSLYYLDENDEQIIEIKRVEKTFKKSLEAKNEKYKESQIWWDYDMVKI